MSTGRLRIRHIAETYPPSYGGGAAITTRDVCRVLVARGHDVRVWCVEAADREPYTIRTEDDNGVRVERVNVPFAAVDPDGWLSGIAQWKEHGRRIENLVATSVDEWRPDIVDYHTARPFGEAILNAMALLGVPVVATLHDGWLICPRLMFLRSPTSTACEGPGAFKCLECMYSHYDGSHLRAGAKLPWRLLKLGAYPAWRLRERASARRNVGGAIARSRFMTETHRGHLRGPIRHIPLGIDLAGLPEKKPRRPRSPLQFGFIGGFQPNKGVLHLLDAAADLKREGLEFGLQIWGPGGQRAVDEIRRRDLESCVQLCGMYQPEERWSVYGAMDVAIMATLVAEPFGRVPMEAAAMGAPTIAPSVGGIKETIRDGIDGLHFRFRDWTDLKRQMRRVIEEKDLLEELIQHLLPPVDVTKQVGEVEKLYFDVIESERGSY